MRVYLKPEVAEGSNEQGVKWVHGGSYELFALKVEEEDFRWYLYFNDYGSKLPAELDGMVEGVSIFEATPAYATREMGQYQHNTATAEVEVQRRDHDKSLYRLEVKAEKLEDARELIHLFKVGKIRPVESYEGSQLGKSRAELEEEVVLAKMMVDRLIDRLRTLEREIEASKGLVFMKKATLVEKLEKVRFGF